MTNWWEWIGFGGGPSTSVETPTVIVTPAAIPTTSTANQPTTALATSTPSSPTDGWDRLKAIYNDELTMEKDVVKRVMRMSFFGGFMVGGATGYAQARQTYELNNVGRKYLSPSDAVKRRIDYAIVRFAKSGFGVGIKCAIISGSIVLLTTHVAAYRDKFGSWYFPAISGATACVLHSALVGGIFAFPIGLIGAVKSIGLGVSSGLTLTAVAHLYAMSMDKSVNEAYRVFKREYEKDLKSEKEWDSRVKEMMENENIWWRQEAVRKLKKLDQEKLKCNDD